MLFETSDNVKINYELTGKGKTIVLVNGFGAYQEIWSAQVPFLNNLGYQVLTTTEIWGRANAQKEDIILFV